MKKLLLILLCVPLMFSCGEKEVVYDFDYRIAIETSGSTSWIFEGEYRPPIHLIDEQLDGSSKNKPEDFISDLNNVLEHIKLPKVDYAVKRSGIRKTKLVFQDYPGGELKISWSGDKNINNEGYDCIWKITHPNPKNMFNVDGWHER